MINGSLTAVDALENGHWTHNAGALNAGGLDGVNWTTLQTVLCLSSINSLKPIGLCLNTVDTIIMLCYNKL